MILATDRSKEALADALQTYLAPCSDNGTSFDLSWIYRGKFIEWTLRMIDCTAGEPLLAPGISGSFDTHTVNTIVVDNCVPEDPCRQ